MVHPCNSAATGYTAYNKDIFGIARDDASGLYQKQSASTDNPALTVYQGSLAETNAENTSTITDKHALMLGANGLIGNVSYLYDAGTAFQNYTLQTITDPVTGLSTQERLSVLFNYKLRAKTTGQTSFTVTMNPGQGEWILVSSDVSFLPTNTRIYKVVNGTAQNVLVNDGDYIGFTSFIKAPAGVANGLVMWLNASKQNTVTLNGAGEVINWIDNSGYGTSFSKINSSSTAPLYQTCDEKMNFHPSVYFRQSRQYLSTRKGPFSIAAPNDYTFFSAINANFNTSNRIYFTSYGALTRSIYPALGVREGTDNTQGRARIYDGGGAGSVDGTAILFNGGATSAIAHTMKKNLYFKLYADGYVQQMNESSAGRGSRLNGPGTLGYGGSSDSRTMIGVMGEHIAYEGEISDSDRDKIDSYLGLKYAITTDKNKTSTSVNFDFKISDGTSVWNGNDTTHQNYHNNVASVIRDDVSDLYNRQSKSTDTGAIVHMGVGKKLGCNAVLGDILVDKTALTWGHNAGLVSTYSLVGNTDVCGVMDSRLNGRIWLVDNTNFNQEIMIGASGSTFPYNGANYQVYLLIADSPSKLTTNKWDQMIPMTFVNGMHVVNYQFTKKYTYFTFGAKMVGSCEGCEFESIKSLDFSRTNWPVRGATMGNYNLGNDFNVTITVQDPNGRLSARYPRSSTQNTLRERRKNTEAVTTKVVFKKDNGEAVSAVTSFEIYDIDRSSNKRDDIQVIGYCNGSPVYPKLSYTYNRPEQSRYSIESDGKAVAKGRGTTGNGNSGYTSQRGRVFVDFENAVEEVDIIYKVITTSSSSTYVGIGPMEYYCPAPLPAPNEDGLIFTKQGPAEVKLCEVVDYTFRAINTNCAQKEVTFTDTLPTGMVWVKNSFSAGGSDINDANISGYGTPTLTVSGLMVPGGSSPYIFRASAIFETTASAGVYQNQGGLKYDRLGTPVTLLSSDRLTGNPFTETTAIASARPEQVVTSLTTDKNCFKLNREMEVTLNINNPNAFSMEDMFLALDYDSDVFTVVANSFVVSPGLTLPADTGEEGSMEFDGFTLPAGTHWIKFKVESSNDIADYEINPVTLNPDDISFGYDLTSESNDDCLASSTTNANGELNLSFCTWCTKPAIGGTSELSKVGISVMKDNFTGWPQNVPNGYLVLEAGKKGMVLTRTTPDAIGSANWVKGMIIFDTSAGKKCISIYNGTEWKCIERSCNE